ncbi:MAG: hypothetical protein JW902_19340 [Syntrophaceae bacterium]|nr:hypothetical protein [Syntrophaceae bacterium]
MIRAPYYTRPQKKWKPKNNSGSQSHGPIRRAKPGADKTSICFQPLQQFFPMDAGGMNVYNPPEEDAAPAALRVPGIQAAVFISGDSFQTEGRSSYG